jgi:hypothetical protein
VLRLSLCRAYACVVVLRLLACAKRNLAGFLNHTLFHTQFCSQNGDAGAVPKSKQAQGTLFSQKGTLS